jgi:pimeloyl-ACP methyl ester carboxylesterase
MIERHYLGLGPKGFHRLHYTEWGSADNPRVVVCVHGLTRNARDFDRLAEALSADFRVVCVDVMGRGESDWAPDAADYTPQQYVSDMNALIARTGADEVDWVGTSMGGLFGMSMACQRAAPIRRMVVNDVGPFVPAAALDGIGEYVGNDPLFEDLQEAESYFRTVHAPFGALSDEDWKHITTHSVRPEADHYRLKYDPAIGAPYHHGPMEDMDLWAEWEAIRCPTLVLRGADSELLLAETAEQMKHRGPRATVVEFPDVGHAPALMSSDQIQTVRRWLLA